MNDLSSALFKAVKGNNIEEVEKLINEGADVNRAHPYEFFLWTPLHLASSKDYKKIVCILSNVKGIDVNAKDKFEKTPLHLAVSQKNEEVVNALLKVEGIEVNIKDTDGHTPLDLANSMGYVCIADALKAKGAVIGDTEQGSESIPLHSITDKETQPDELNLDEVVKLLESDIQPLNDFEQFTQSDQLI